MKVKELKDFLATVPDNAEVIIIDGYGYLEDTTDIHLSAIGDVVITCAVSDAMNKDY